MTGGIPGLSLLFFASHAESKEPYALFRSATQIADREGFEAIWLPERHFNVFGGLYPSPSVLGAFLAATTRNVRIRAGSVVMPLQDPLRVAEEWSMIDQLSGGRVDLAFAQGWNPADFVLAPDNYPRRLAALYAGVEEVSRLWEGGEVMRRDGNGNTIPVRTFPRPVQSVLRTWITCVGGTDRFREAGSRGFNILTGLLMQNPDELARNIAMYREARAGAGFDPQEGRVSLMLHTYLNENEDAVQAKIRGPLKNYLKESFDLWKQRFENLQMLEASGKEMMWEFAFQKYYRTSGLFGTPSKAAEKLRGFAAMGVDEIACLLDFGLPESDILSGLELLAGVGARPNPYAPPLGKQALAVVRGNGP